MKTHVTGVKMTLNDLLPDGRYVVHLYGGWTGKYLVDRIHGYWNFTDGTLAGERFDDLIVTAERVVA